MIENKWVNSDTDENLLLTNTITEGKNKKQNYNWHTATAFNEINWNKTAELIKLIKQLHKQHYQLHLLLTSLTSFLSYIYELTDVYILFQMFCHHFGDWCLL